MKACEVQLWHADPKYRKHSLIVVHLEHLYLAHLYLEHLYLEHLYLEHLYLFLEIFIETLNVLQLSCQLSLFSIHISQFINTVQGLTIAATMAAMRRWL